LTLSALSEHNVRMSRANRYDVELDQPEEEDSNGGTVDAGTAADVAAAGADEVGGGGSDRGSQEGDILAPDTNPGDSNRNHAFLSGLSELATETSDRREISHI
jgi:hypothetical protein